MGKILILRVEAKYNVLGIFADYIAEEFNNLGYQVIVVDLMKSFIELRKIFMHTYKFIFTFNGAGSDFNIEGWNIYSKLKIPYITILVDHPIYHNYRISQSIEKFACACVDKGHTAFIEKYIEKINNTTYLPHGGCIPQNIIPYQERVYNIVFSGSYSEPQKIYNELCTGVGVVGIELVKYWMENIELTLEEALQNLLEKHGKELTKEEFVHVLYDLRIVDRYIRAYYRDIIIKEVINNNIKIDVFGTGWDKFKDSSGLLIRHGELSFSDVLEVMGNAKMVLNVTTLFGNGGHERVFSSMLAGAVCLTDRTIYLEEEFIEDKDIVFYDLNKIHEIPNKIKNILDNNQLAEGIAISAREKATNKHQWKNRAEEIIKIFESL